MARRCRFRDSGWIGPSFTAYLPSGIGVAPAVIESSERLQVTKIRVRPVIAGSLTFHRNARVSSSGLRLSISQRVSADDRAAPGDCPGRTHGLTDQDAQQPRHRGLGTFRKVRSRARMRSRSCAPRSHRRGAIVRAHLAPIPQTGAREDAAAFLQHEIVAPSVDARPPVERRIPGRSRRAAPESFIERIFERMTVYGRNRSVPRCVPIDQLNANRDVLAPRGPNRGVMLGEFLHRKLRD